MEIAYNETFEREGVAHGPFRVLVATNVMARLLGKPDDLFDAVYYFGRVTDQESVEEFLYEPYPSGNAQVAVSRTGLSLEQQLRIQTGESYRELRDGEIDTSEYPKRGALATYLKRTETGLWAYQFDGLGLAPNARGSYRFVAQEENGGVTSIKTFCWNTMGQLAKQIELFGGAGPVDKSLESTIVDYPGLCFLDSCAYG